MPGAARRTLGRAATSTMRGGLAGPAARNLSILSSVSNRCARAPPRPKSPGSSRGSELQSDPKSSTWASRRAVAAFSASSTRFSNSSISFRMSLFFSSSSSYPSTQGLP